MGSWAESFERAPPANADELIASRSSELSCSGAICDRAWPFAMAAYMLPDSSGAGW
jgi:hypothetical protein